MNFSQWNLGKKESIRKHGHRRPPATWLWDCVAHGGIPDMTEAEKLLSTQWHWLPSATELWPMSRGPTSLGLHIPISSLLPPPCLTKVCFPLSTISPIFFFGEMAFDWHLWGFGVYGCHIFWPAIPLLSIVPQRNENIAAEKLVHWCL